ncbi:MAG: hypothetical protein LBL52_03820 [Rickettsiales bacterium]|nr:hypothetical protein [Rickettsiales bacterium]
MKEDTISKLALGISVAALAVALFAVFGHCGGHRPQHGMPKHHDGFRGGEPRHEDSRPDGMMKHEPRGEKSSALPDKK